MDEKTPNKIIEVIKSHKKEIIRGGLILLGVGAGLALVAAAKKIASTEMIFEDDVNIEMVDGKLVISNPDSTI